MSQNTVEHFCNKSVFILMTNNESKERESKLFLYAAKKNEYTENLYNMKFDVL